MSDFEDGSMFSFNDLFGGGGGFNSGYDLPGGGDTGMPTLPGDSFNVGPGQIPSDVYQYLLGQGGLQPGMDTSMPGGGGGSGMLNGLGKMLGLTGKDGSVNLAGLLPLLGIGAGAFNQYNATGKASQQMQDAINNSNKIVTDTLAPNKELYEPWRQAGLGALDKMQNQAPSNLAGQFSGGLANQFSGGLAGGFNSLGSGKGIKLSQMSKGGK